MAEANLFLVYMVGGLVTVFSGPKIGRLADRHGKFRVYAMLVVGACVVIHLLTSSGPRPEWQVLVLAGFFFMLAGGRFIPSQATISMAVPPARRGAYMSLVACSRDLASGLTTAIGGMVSSTVLTLVVIPALLTLKVAPPSMLFRTPEDGVAA